VPLNFLHEYLRVAAILVTFNAVDAEARAWFKRLASIVMLVCVTSSEELVANPTIVNIVPPCDALGDVVEVESVYT
jgi:hypothetical protein